MSEQGTAVSAEDSPAEENAVETSEETESKEAVESEESKDDETSEETADEGETESEDEDTEDKEFRKLSSNERIQQLVNQRNELEDKFKQLEAKFNEQYAEKQKAEELPFIDVDPEKFKEKVATLYEEYEELNLEGDKFEAAQKQREINKLLDAYEENEAKKQQWEELQSKKMTSEQQFQQRIKYIDESAEFYRQQNNIPEDVWSDGSRFFAEQCQKNPVLGRKFAEKINVSPMEAIEFAYKYTVDNMGKTAKETKVAKENAKNKLVTGSSSGDVSTVKTFDDLMKLSGAEIDKFINENPTKYEKMLNSRLRRSA